MAIGNGRKLDRERSAIRFNGEAYLGKLNLVQARHKGQMVKSTQEVKSSNLNY